MENLIFRKGIEKNSLPTVYFFCHPGDFEKYFGVIAEEIEKSAECQICCFKPHYEINKEDIKSMIEASQLVVFPVSSRFLRRESRAFEVDFKIAEELKTPMLPILVEAGLENEFNKKCGEIHCLDRFKVDETAISYDIKLKRFLETVLVNEKTAERVRAAFDASIFLSYRKKDRAYANKLMRLIHKNDFCRDIAIWFDEYLTPGENFNGAIADAIESSSLFTMVVTPNLINEPNYVISDEYPLALKLNIPVLPAVMEKTEELSLKKHFEGIPEGVKAEDDAALSEALRRNLERIATGKGNGEPSHLFLIGLAYLHGINVETDAERGMELIEAAADAGLTEAIEKAVSVIGSGMIFTGEYEKYSGYCKRLLAIRIEEENSFEILMTLFYLCRAYEKLRKYREIIEVYEETAGKISEDALAENEKWVYTAVKGILARALCEMKCFDKAECILEEIRPEVERRAADGSGISELFSWYNSVAVLLSRNMQFEKAAVYFDKAEKTGIECGADPFSMAILYDNRSCAELKNGNTLSAIQKARRAVESFEEAAKAIPEYFGYDYAIACDNLGVALIQGQKYQEALEVLEKAERQFSELEKVYGNACYYNSAKNKGFLAGVYVYIEPEKSMKYCDEALKLLEEAGVSEVPDTVLADIFNDMGVSSRVNGDYENAIRLQEKALEIREYWASVNPEAFTDHVAKSYNNLGRCYTDENYDKKDYAKGIEFIKKSLELYEASYGKKLPADIKATLLRNIGDAYKADGNKEKAIEYYEKVTEADKSKEISAEQLVQDMITLIRLYGKCPRKLKLCIKCAELLEKLMRKERGKYLYISADINEAIATLSFQTNKLLARKHAYRALELYKLIELSAPSSCTRDIQNMEKFIRIYL